jgi:hypothetical protein
MHKGKRRDLERLLVALGTALAVAVAVPALGFAGPPVTTEPEAGDFCGVPGTFVDTVSSEFSREAGGKLIEHSSVRSVFTAEGTLKQIVTSESSTTVSEGPIDNGNGTFSFITRSTGLVLKFQILNGPVLKAASGEAIRSAGILVIEDVFSSPVPSEETFITTNVSFHGPHLLRQGVDICGPAIDYLTDP